MEIDISSELHHIIKTKQLLEHPGFREYMNRVGEFYDLKSAEIYNLTKEPLTEDKVQILNKSISERNALGCLLLVKEELVDSISTDADEVVNKESDQ